MNPSEGTSEHTRASRFGYSTSASYLLPVRSMLSKLGVRRLLFVVSCVAVLLSPFAYIGNYAGDSQVHLIYGENAAEGRFFEFNPGEKSPGVTSPGYMLFIAGLYRAFPAAAVPAIVKGANLLLWYGLVVLVFLTARRYLRSGVWAMIAALAAGLLPGSVYNSTIGMENGIFAFFIFLWFYAASRSGWFTVPANVNKTVRHELALGFLLGLACWLRPEGFIVAAIALIYRGLTSFGSGRALAGTMLRSAVFLAPFLMMTGALAYFHLSQTDHLLPSSGLSRMLMSNVSPDSYQIGPLFVSSRFAIRLAEYFPLTTLWLLANWLYVTGRLELHGSKSGAGFLIVLFWAGFILYSSLLGSIHVARLAIFLMPALVLVAVMGAQWLWNTWSQSRGSTYRYGLRISMVASAVVLGGVFLAETGLRLELDSDASLWRCIKAPSERQATSDALFNLLGQPQTLPISVAMQEVQLRYWLDDRFEVRSLDGRVDPALLDHATRVSVDHIGYLKERWVQFLLDTPAYNRDPHLWSLRRLAELQPGEALDHEGLAFSRLPVQPPVPEKGGTKGPGGWRWFANADGPIVLRTFTQVLIRVEPAGPG